MKRLGIIPARFESSRLPGKVLANIGDKPMIQHVYEQALKSSLNKVVIATDDDRVYEAVKAFGGSVVMTSEKHQSGTDRCYEALESLDGIYDFVINIQGDEPFINPEQINLLVESCSRDVEIGTLIKKIDDSEALFNPNVVKVVRSASNDALYFSRSPIPFLRSQPKESWHIKFNYWRHIGMYGYRADILKKITTLNQGKLEIAESLEQLRWLENNFRIKTIETNISTVGVDTPEDLDKARIFWSQQ